MRLNLPIRPTAKPAERSRRRKLLSGLACNKGNFAVEFALITPLLIMMLLAVFDVSTIIQDKMVLQNAAQTGIQYGLIRRPVQSDLQQVENTVRSSLPDSWLESGPETPVSITASLQCECSYSGSSSCAAGCPAGELRRTFLNLTIAKQRKFLFPYPGFGDGVLLSDRASVRLQ